MATLFTDVSVYWDGNAIDSTVGNVTRAVVGIPVFGKTTATPQVARMWESGSRQTGNPVIGPIEGAIWIKGTTSTTSSRAAVERELLDDWQLVTEAFNPFDGALELRVDRQDATPTTTSRVVQGRVIEILTAKPVLTPPTQGDGDYGIYGQGAIGDAAYWYPVMVRAEYGLWQKRTAETDTQTATTTGATLTTNSNDGIRSVPVQIEIGATSGTPTSLTMSASGQPTVTITNPTNGDIFDLGYGTRGHADLTNSAANTGKMSVGLFPEIPVSSTDWTVTTDTGTAAVTLRFKPEYGTW